MHCWCLCLFWKEKEKGGRRHEEEGGRGGRREEAGLRKGEDGRGGRRGRRKGEEGGEEGKEGKKRKGRMIEERGREGEGMREGKGKMKGKGGRKRKERKGMYLQFSRAGVCAPLSMTLRRSEGEGEDNMCLRTGEGMREGGVLSAVWRRDGLGE